MKQKEEIKIQELANNEIESLSNDENRLPHYSQRPRNHKTQLHFRSLQCQPFHHACWQEREILRN